MRPQGARRRVHAGVAAGLCAAVGCSAPGAPGTPPRPPEAGGAVASGPFAHGIVRAVRRCTPDGAPVVTVQLFRAPAGCADSEWPGEFLWIDVAHGPGDAVPHEVALDGPAALAGGTGFASCYTARSSRCEPVRGQLTLDEVSPGTRATGRVRVELPDGPSESSFVATWCGGSYEVSLCPHSGGGTSPPPPAAAPPPAPPPDAAPPASPPASACTADASHCCQRGGAIVRPGGCQPVYPGGVVPATERGPDGFCRRIECNVRCLPPTALVATPGGEVAVAELRAGDLVWTVDADGRRRAAPLLRVAHVPVSGDHDVLELSLADGRRVRASAGHPAVDGRALAELRVGDVLDGARVEAVRAVPLAADRTWDLLPAGPTGAYWADGVLLGSTLAASPSAD